MITAGKNLKPIEDTFTKPEKLAQTFKAKNQEWMFVYETSQYELVNRVLQQIQTAMHPLGMLLEGEPMFVEVPSDSEFLSDLELQNISTSRRKIANGENFTHCISTELDKTQIILKGVFVLTQRRS